MYIGVPFCNNFQLLMMHPLKEISVSFHTELLEVVLLDSSNSLTPGFGTTWDISSIENHRILCVCLFVLIGHCKLSYFSMGWGKISLADKGSVIFIVYILLHNNLHTFNRGTSECVITKSFSLSLNNN